MNNVIFKKFEVIGNTKDAAKEQAGSMNLMVDATASYNKWEKNHIASEEAVKEWMKEYLKNKKYNKPGLGAYIVTQSHVVDSRERPYKEEKPKYEVRTHTPEAFYILRDEATNTELGRYKTSKEAKDAAKEEVANLHENINIFKEWVAKEGNSLYTSFKYTPSKGTRPCKMIIFGYEAVED